MQRPSLSLFVSAAFVVSIFTAPMSAQVEATFATFGSGCAGTGSGLDTAVNVLPAFMATRFGSPNAIPFGWTPVRYQQIFAGAHLPSAFTMAALSLRQSNRGPLSNRFTADLEIRVGYTTQTPTTMSTTFASNFDSGPAVVVVPRRLVEFPDFVATGPSSPADFFVTIPWAATFDWVPATGRNFLVEVVLYGNSYGGIGSGYAFDSGGDSTTARLYGSSPTASSGTLERNLGLVMGIRALTNTAIPVLYSTNTPQIDDTFRVRFSQARPSSNAFLLLGFSNTVWSGLGLPFDMGWLNAPGCAFLTSVDNVQSVSVNASGAASFTYDVPNDIYVLGLRFYNQGLIADPAANGFGFAFTNGGVAVIGNQ